LISTLDPPYQVLVRTGLGEEGAETMVVIGGFALLGQEAIGLQNW
jgi:hypothetical protein